MRDLSDIVQGSMLLVDKPLGWTSFDVVNKIRGTIRHSYGLKKIKVGHAGTLDPAATGLLIICTGKMTKQIQSYQDQVKVYEGQLRLGATTPSYDSESEVDQHYPTDHLTAEAVEACRHHFVGLLEQKPPIYSAIKKDGVRLYKLARAGKKVDVPTRKVHIEDLIFTHIDLPEVSFTVTCSKGTYIRSLAHDIGQHLGSGAYLTALRRTQIGDYHVSEAWALPALVEQIRTCSHEHTG